MFINVYKCLLKHKITMLCLNNNNILINLKYLYNLDDPENFGRISYRKMK